MISKMTDDSSKDLLKILIDDLKINGQAVINSNIQTTDGYTLVNVARLGIQFQIRVRMIEK